MATQIDLGQPTPDWIEFHVRRSLAIQAHGGVEQSIFGVLACLIPDVGAATVIFNAVGATHRNRILEELIEQKFGSRYQAYFHGEKGTPNKTGMMNLVRRLDGRRNEIVHWHSVRCVEDDREHTVLMPPASWAQRNTARLTVADLIEFTSMADFIQRSLNMFRLVALTEISSRLDKPLLAVFDRPCTYPPPAGHPIGSR